MLWTWAEISSVALAVWLASAFPLRWRRGEAPAVLAGARRLDGGVSARRLVWLAIVLNQGDHLADLWVPAASPSTTAVGARASLRLSGDLGERVTCCEILLIDVSTPRSRLRTVPHWLKPASRRWRRPRSAARPRAAVAHRGRHALHFADRGRNRFDNTADLAPQAGRELAPRRLAAKFRTRFGIAAFRIGAGGFGLLASGFGGFARSGSRTSCES